MRIRRADIEKLSREIQEFETKRKYEKRRERRANYGVNEAEQAFLKHAEGKGRTFRHGWPDFLLIQPDGSAIGVEVKRRNDWCSLRQQRMFSALESIGVRVYIWEFETPGTLTPWQKWSALHRPRDATESGHQKGRVTATRSR